MDLEMYIDAIQIARSNAATALRYGDASMGTTKGRSPSASNMDKFFRGAMDDRIEATLAPLSVNSTKPPSLLMSPSASSAEMSNRSADDETPSLFLSLFKLVVPSLYSVSKISRRRP
ncbi:MAG: hypothetical protein RQ839_06895 [Thermoproteus sp.]|nr:hypothetical protein [Thermoproteus sp.]MDT7881758.1 hypothetical protein [Thermoproteus sp.]